MLDLKKLIYNKTALLYKNLSQQVFVEKTFFRQLEVDQYFIKIFTKNEIGNFMNLGYLYFDLDFEENISHFIGMYIKPEFRGTGLSTLLISIWIQICLENEVASLETICNQRKPFIVYSLKRYGFDMRDKRDLMCNKVFICQSNQKPEDLTKYLFFESDDQKATFLKSPIASADSYSVLDEITSDFTVLDTILLKQPYSLQDEGKAYKLSMKKLHNSFSDVNTYFEN